MQDPVAFDKYSPEQMPANGAVCLAWRYCFAGLILAPCSSSHVTLQVNLMLVKHDVQLPPSHTSILADRRGYGRHHTVGTER